MATANIAARASRQERFRSPQTMPLDAGHARPGRPRRLLDFPAEARSPAVIAMLMPQDDQVWINYVSNWIKMKRAKGFFEETKAKWGL